MRASGSEPLLKAKPFSLSHTQLTFARRTMAQSKRTSAAASNSQSPGEVKERPLKERLIHLLVLRPYKRSELLLRLQKDGLMDRELGSLDSELTEVRRSASGGPGPVLTSLTSRIFLSSCRSAI